MNERPTPEVDNAKGRAYEYGHDLHVVSADFARNLERQRNDYHRKACDIADERDRACERLSVVSLQLEDCKAQRDGLLAALEALVEVTVKCEKQLTEELYRVDFSGESEPLCKARAAIAAVKGGK